jgi:hypothetical protein
MLFNELERNRIGIINHKQSIILIKLENLDDSNNTSGT